MFSHEHAYTCTFAVIIDERPVTPYLSDVDSPTAGSKHNLIGWRSGRRYYKAGVKSAIFDCLVNFSALQCTLKSRSATIIM